MRMLGFIFLVFLGLTQRKPKVGLQNFDDDNDNSVSDDETEEDDNNLAKFICNFHKYVD